MCVNSGDAYIGTRIVITVFILRRQDAEAELNQMLWRVHWDDVQEASKRAGTVVGKEYK